GFCPPDRVIELAEQVVRIQRDFGDRVDRKRARFKYTIDDRGLDWFKSELEGRLGWQLGEARPFRFDTNGDRYGWTDGLDGTQHYTLFIENGRVKDADDFPLMTALREIAQVHTGEFRLTPNQNLIIARVTAEKRPEIEALLRAHGLDDTSRPSV